MNHTQIFIGEHFYIGLHIVTATKSMPGHMLNDLKSICKSDILLDVVNCYLQLSLLAIFTNANTHICMHTSVRAPKVTKTAKKETLRTVSVRDEGLKMYK